MLAERTCEIVLWKMSVRLHRPECGSVCGRACALCVFVRGKAVGVTCLFLYFCFLLFFSLD